MVAAAAARLTELREDAYTKILKCFVKQAYDMGREKLMSDLRGALAISNDVHAELMEAVRDGREPARVAAAAAARALPNAVSGASSNQASDAHASALLPSGLHDVSTAFAASAAAGHAPGGQLKRSASGLSGPSRKRSSSSAKARPHAAAGVGARGGGSGGGGAKQRREGGGAGLLGPGMDSEAALAGQFTHSHLPAPGWSHDAGPSHAGGGYSGMNGMAPLSGSLAHGVVPLVHSTSLGSSVQWGHSAEAPVANHYMVSAHSHHPLVGGLSGSGGPAQFAAASDARGASGGLAMSAPAAPSHLPPYQQYAALPYLSQQQQQHQQQQQLLYAQQLARSGAGLSSPDPAYGNGPSAALPLASKRSAPEDAAKPAPKRRKSTSAPKIKVVSSGEARGGGGGHAALVLDPNIGRRVSVMYPSHGGWYGGIITDYNGLTKEHCITYDVGSKDESFEWMNVHRAPPTLFKWESGRVDVTKLPAPNHGGKRGGPKATSGKGGGSKNGVATAPSQHSQQAAPAMQGYHGGYANGIAAVRPAAKPRFGGGSKLKKLTGGPAKGRAGAKASAARVPAKPRPLKQELGAAKQPPLEASPFTGALPPKVAPPPRNGVYGGTAASRRVTESDDEFSDGLRGGMRESPTPSPSPPHASQRNGDGDGGHHWPSALDALRHLQPAGSPAPADSEPYGAPHGLSAVPRPGTAPAAALPAQAAMQQQTAHAAYFLAAEAPRFAEKQLPPEFLTQGSGRTDPSPSPPPDVLAASSAAARQGQQPQLASTQVVISSAGHETAAAYDGRPGATGDSGGQARIAMPGVSAPAADDSLGTHPAFVPAAHPASDAGPVIQVVGQQGQQQQQQQEQQQAEYEVAPEHQFRIVSSDEESSDSDNSNSGTGY